MEFNKTVSKLWGNELWIANGDLYCGKILTFNKGYFCSLHYHKKKTETFYLLEGKVIIKYGKFETIQDKINKFGISYIKDGKFVRDEDCGLRVLYKGECFHIEPYMVHQIVPIENSKIIEISTQHFEDDSYRILDSGKSQKIIEDPHKYWNEIYDYKNNSLYSMWRPKFVADLVYKNKDKIESVLELGCNTGCNLENIHGILPNIKLTGLDINKKALDFAIEKGIDYVDFISGDICNLKSFKDKSFDLIITTGILLYFNPFIIDLITSEIMRISKKFMLCIERNGKNKVLQEERFKDYKILINNFDFVEKFKLKNINCRALPLKSMLPKNAKLKNNKDLIIANFTDEEFIT